MLFSDVASVNRARLAHLLTPRDFWGGEFAPVSGWGGTHNESKNILTRCRFDLSVRCGHARVAPRSRVARGFGGLDSPHVDKLARSSHRGILSVRRHKTFQASLTIRSECGVYSVAAWSPDGNSIPMEEIFHASILFNCCTCRRDRDVGVHGIGPASPNRRSL